jgi:hypothetical protein
LTAIAGGATVGGVAAKKKAGWKTVGSSREPSNAGDGDAGADARRLELLAALRKDRDIAPCVTAYESAAAAPGGKFGKNGLKTRAGKLFALFTQGTLVVKLPNERVAALVDEGVGLPFDPGHGRLMKGWLTITSRQAPWVALTKEAYAFVERDA